MLYIERIHLEIIHAIHHHGSMTAAAKALHLTQSALSHSMRKLEDQLSIKLWHREGRKLIPTQAGTHLLNAASRLIPQFLNTEEQIQQFARGERGTLRIGMECHPCYRWLHRITTPYLREWPMVDLDVRQAFQFGAVGALFAHEIDILVTPDPYHKKGLSFESVFDYEQVLVVASDHKLADSDYVIPRHLGDELLFTFPVPQDRLDIYKHFLTPAGRSVRRQKIVETTDIMLQMVACGRGVAALPRWLVEEHMKEYSIQPIRLGKKGLAKKIFLGIRDDRHQVDYLQDFMERARNSRPSK
ncbi:MAG: LysR family transcriptional regulator [Opitutales bacterium]|jgi:LysR family transcriptional regulator for metE and metH